MELSLLRSLMSKNFYEDHKTTCPDKLFSKDIRKVKSTLDCAMKQYNNDVTVADLHALFLANNATMTTATKDMYNTIFSKLKNETPLTKEIAQDVLAKLYRQSVGEDVANLGFEYVNGSLNSLEPLRKLLNQHQDNFLPNFKVEWDDMSIDALLAASAVQCQWKFNIPSLARRIEGISAGHLVIVGARPNTGKTSFHASIIAAENGFASQGAKCMILCNEEATDRVGSRYLSAATNMSVDEVRSNLALARKRYQPVNDSIKVRDVTGMTMDWVEAVVKAEEPDIVVLDMGDKFAARTGERSDIYLKEAAIHARNIAKQYNCAIIWMSQLSAEAEGRVNVNQSMLEGSKTGKAAEADLMILISKDIVIDGSEEEDLTRYLILAKNKLKGGWHGRIDVQLDGERARYSA